jgi:YgiT-type zinc finger domain-containing protein
MIKRKLIDQCPLYGGDKIMGKTLFSVDLGFGVILVRDVPATICSQCGADWLSDDVATQLEEMVRDARLRHLQVEVTTFQSGEKFSLETVP